MRVPAFRPDPSRPTVVSPRVFDAVDELASALGRATACSVRVIEGDETPPDGYIVVFSPDDIPSEIADARRCILINADRSAMADDAERNELVAEIETQRYFRWRSRREQETGDGVFGKKTVVLAMGGEGTKPDSANYTSCRLDGAADLVVVLAAYLKAHR